MNNKETNSWVTLSEEKKYDNPWISLSEYKVLNPSGKPGIYGVVSFKNLAIGILPLDTEYNTWLVGQWRYPLKEYSWEIPEGGGPLGINPLESAKRELKEETGLIAKKYTELGKINTSNSVCNESGILYLAQDLELKEAEPEESEDLQLRKLPFGEAYNMVMEGRITDSLSMVAILKTKALMDKGLV
jgi:ADP-ribose pyrophosphatase